MNPGDVAPFMMFLTLIVGVAVVLRGPVGRALARRIEGKGADSEALAEQLADLEHRLAEAELDRQRIADLEERVDFAERMLASGPDRKGELR